MSVFIESKFQNFLVDSLETPVLCKLFSMYTGLPCCTAFLSFVSTHILLLTVSDTLSLGIPCEELYVASVIGSYYTLNLASHAENLYCTNVMLAIAFLVIQFVLGSL